MREETAVLDRFEEDVAVFETLAGETRLVPRALLPPDARPGVVARLALHEDPPRVETLADETEERKRALAEKRDRLRARRGA